MSAYWQRLIEVERRLRRLDHIKFDVTNGAAALKQDAKIVSGQLSSMLNGAGGGGAVSFDPVATISIKMDYVQFSGNPPITAPDFLLYSGTGYYIDTTMQAFLFNTTSISLSSVQTITISPYTYRVANYNYSLTDSGVTYYASFSFMYRYTSPAYFLGSNIGKTITNSPGAINALSTNLSQITSIPLNGTTGTLSGTSGNGFGYVTGSGGTTYFSATKWTVTW